MQQPHVLVSYRRPRTASGGRSSSAAGILALYGLVGLVALVVGAYAGGSHANAALGGTLAGLVLVLPLLWHRPVLGVYLLLGGATVFETFILGFPDSITDRVPFFQNMSSVGGPDFLITSAAEIVMVFSLGAVILRRMSTGQRPLELGPLFWAVAPYTAMVGFGLVYGVGTGGNWEIALWEARAQIYLFMVYLLVVNTVRDPRHLGRLMWVFLAGVALKGFIGIWRFLVTLQGDLVNVAEISNTNSILSHEESYLFALFFLLALALFLFRSHRGQLWFACLTALPVAVAFLANQRRVGILALLVGIVLVTLFAYLLVKSRRRAIVAVAAVLALVLPAYIGAMWNSTGVLAEPARAVKSLVQPNERDAGSNNYRVIEAQNLKYNIYINPIIGRGYGKPIIFFVPLPFIGNLFVWWDIIPHNTVLWVWMRLGYIGFAAFWFFIGRSLIAAVLAAKQARTPYFQGLGAFTVAALSTWVMMGALDMGLVDYRETVLMGTLVGLLGCLPAMERAAEQGAAQVRSAHVSRPGGAGRASPAPAP